MMEYLTNASQKEPLAFTLGIILFVYFLLKATGLWSSVPDWLYRNKRKKPKPELSCNSG